MFKCSRLIPVLALAACSGGNNLRSAGAVKSAQAPQTSTSNSDEKNLSDKTKEEAGEELGDESVSRPVAINGSYLVCLRLSDAALSLNEASVGCSLVRDGVKIQVPTGTDINWSYNGNQNLIVTFTELLPTDAYHVLARIKASSESQLIQLLPALRISASLNGTSLESNLIAQQGLTCVESTSAFANDANNIRVPFGCSSVTLKVWGGGGAGGMSATGGTPGNGGGGGFSSQTVAVSASSLLNVKIGRKGQCGGAAGTGASSGGAGGVDGNGSLAEGSGASGSGGSGLTSGGAGTFGGGGGGGVGTSAGGGGGGSSVATVDNVAAIFAGGGGGGGAGVAGGNGGAGCEGIGADGSNVSGGGGGAGSCIGDTSANGTGKAPGNSSEALGYAAGGSFTTGACTEANDGKDGLAVLVFSP